jgi:putative flippase GtrA
MRKLYRQHREKINYLLVGGWNTVFGYFVFAGLYFLLHQDLHYMVLFIISNIISITNAYIGYKVFVFKTKGNYLKEYLRFYVVYGAAMALNLVLLPLAVELFRLSPVIAQGGLVFVNVLFSYVGHKRYSFGSSGYSANS